MFQIKGSDRLCGRKDLQKKADNIQKYLYLSNHGIINRIMHERDLEIYGTREIWRKGKYFLD